MSEWRTIDSAPKDGEKFLAWAELVADEEDEDGSALRRGVVEHYPVVAYFIFGDFVEFPYRGSLVQNQRFTHWMPISPPSLTTPRGE